MSYKPVVLLDVDGVIANFVDPYLRIANNVLNTSFVAEDITEYNIKRSLKLTDAEYEAVGRAIGRVGMAASMDPLPGAIDGVKEVMKVADVYFVTSVFDVCPTWSYDRRLWLDKYFGDGVGHNAVFTKRKHLVKGDVFVDDMPYHIDSWSKKNYGYAVLWKQLYNKSCGSSRVNVVSTNDWKDIVELVETYDVWGSVF